jgi:hypothetical protein
MWFLVGAGMLSDAWTRLKPYKMWFGAFSPLAFERAPWSSIEWAVGLLCVVPLIALLVKSITNHW